MLVALRLRQYGWGSRAFPCRRVFPSCSLRNKEISPGRTGNRSVRGGALLLTERGHDQTEHPASLVDRGLAFSLFQPKNRVEALHVRGQSKVRQEQQQKGDQRITVCVRAQLPRIVGQAHQRGEYLQVVPVDRGPHRSTCGCIVFEVGCGRQSTVTWVIVEVPDPGPDEFVQSPEKIG